MVKLAIVMGTRGATPCLYLFPIINATHCLGVVNELQEEIRSAKITVVFRQAPHEKRDGGQLVALGQLHFHIHVLDEML